MDEMQFNLSEKLEYSHKNGEFAETATIFIEPPSFDCLDEVARLSSYVTRAMMDSTKYSSITDNSATPDKAGDAEIDAKSVRLILFAAASVDVPEVIQEFKKILIKCGRVAEEKDYRFLEEHFSKLEVEDILSMMCEYIANFITPSLL